MIQNILSNIYTQIALVFSAFGGLLSDQLGGGYVVVIMISLLILLYAIYDEYKKEKIYSAKNLPVPVVFNISNPADAKNALNALFEIINQTHPHHKANLEKYLQYHRRGSYLQVRR